MQRGEIRNPITVAILPMVTCGIYGIIWLMGVMDDLNKGLGREEFSAGKEIGLTFLTCGIWGYWLIWRLCQATVEVQQSWGVQPQMEPTILFVLCLFVGPAGFYMVQTALNETWENGTPGGAAGGMV